MLHQGIAPSKERQATNAAKVASSESSCFEIVTQEWFSKFQSQWAESSAKEILRRLEHEICSYLGNRPITEVTAPEVLETLNRIVDRGSIETAHRVRGLISQVMRYGVATNRLIHDTWVQQ